jgi:hypothetical protein
MKKAALFILILGGIWTSSCKKLVHQEEENVILNIMTNGQWYVTNYTQNDTDITNTFSGYSFQFRTNGTVSGIIGGVSTNGTWSANISSHSITSNFPTAGDPLDKLNAIWTITDSYPDSVSANAVINTATNYLSLKKE